MSRYEYPEDEFDAADDEGPVPVGVHRAPVPGWRSWVPLLAVLIIVPLLAWGAVQLLGRHLREGCLDHATHARTWRCGTCRSGR